ncbi:hypothetical protein GLAREA_08553 [Glarea lozoyensis ATCC 20868]|uniref:BTB domain-containing protein n=1 Tax=Glarea lozoyensis (strain ATCC 20868 / MF5171) TaxID=1116229 RepID=S3CFH8_GLAL2|nr:uncharacterized protein GLAREA_08553 [Glarea lozoyensis ATCC 20868]EPE24700.1 hypothetical protein GLAREA_08553 [Glarea lozoyensis ATCC 20868]
MASPALLPPIKFSLPGGEPQDTHLEVFGQTFLVHSVVLKMNSEYFRKFLDSPDKSEDDFPQGGGIRYKWVTQLDQQDTGTDAKKCDGWLLVWEKSLVKNDSSYQYSGDEREQIRAFETLLQAIYRRPIKLSSTTQLGLVTELTDFYRALPVLSYAVTHSLFSSRDFAATIPSNCLILLPIAVKLRVSVIRGGLTCIGRERFVVTFFPVLLKSQPTMTLWFCFLLSQMREGTLGVKVCFIVLIPVFKRTFKRGYYSAHCWIDSAHIREPNVELFRGQKL